MKSSKQGDFDSACGLYAAINGVHFLDRRTKKNELFLLAIKHLVKKGQSDRLLVEGMGRTILNDLLTLFLANRVDISISRPFWTKSTMDVSFPEIRNVLDEHLQSDGKRIAILPYWYCTYYISEEDNDLSEHWTVLYQRTNKRYKILDSSVPDSYIAVTNCRKWDDLWAHKAKPYAIHSSSIFLSSQITQKKE